MDCKVPTSPPRQDGIFNKQRGIENSMNLVQATFFHSFNSYGPLKVLDNQVHDGLATRSNMKDNQSAPGVDGPEHSNAVVTFQDKPQKVNLSSINPIVSSDCILS